MNSTCRGEGEGLNCKTRRQRGCVLIGCRDKRCFRGICTPGMGSGQEVLRVRECKTTSPPRVQRDSQESSRLPQRCGDGGTSQREHTNTDMKQN